MHVIKCCLQFAPTCLAHVFPSSASSCVRLIDHLVNNIHLFQDGRIMLNCTARTDRLCFRIYPNHLRILF